MNIEKPAGSVGAGSEPPALLSPSGATGRPLTQLEMIAQAFDRGEKLTVLTALHRYGIYALSQRCGELYKQGYPLHTESVKTPTGKWIAEYSKGGIAHG